MELIQMLKALADETRLRILNLLGQGELCVCELELLLDVNQSNASRHLNRLTNAKVISFEKRAQYVYYKLNEDILQEHAFFKEILENELPKVDQCKEDLARLKNYRQQGFSCEDIKDGKVCLNG